MFSGGVDSTLCLDLLVNEGATPNIFHFRTTKLNGDHEKRIRKIVRLLSPKSPYYTFRSWCKDYSAHMDESFPYYAVRWRHHGKRKWFEPLMYVDNVVLGYTRWLYWTHEDQRAYRGNQRVFIKNCEMNNLPFRFPVCKLKRPELDAMFMAMPVKIRQLVVSSTRHYDFGGGSFV